MLELKSELCCGCTACVSACPTQCLQMVDNGEGFLIPSIKENSTCVDCGLCNKVCPVLNRKAEIKQLQTGYIVQNKDDQIRKESTSGGAFSAIAQYVFDLGGIVYGAAYGDNFRVEHIGIEDESQLWRLRNSKYVQSFLGDTFRQIEKQLKQGRTVCFSGTPCQIEGLHSFLRKDYENLIFVDVVCHGIGSPLIWEKYLELNEGNVPEHIYFRWKHYGYKYSTMSFFKDNKEVYYGGVESDAMLRAYFSNSCDRLTCYDCPFKKRYRISDITIWDCFQPRYFDKSFDDDKGTTSVLVHSEKGSRIFDGILKKKLLKYCKVDADALVYGNREMVDSVSCGNAREALFLDAKKLAGKELFEKYFPCTVKTRIKKVIRINLLKLGIYNKVKYWLFLLRRYRAKNSRLFK